MYEADEVIAAGGDIAISPDNIDTSDKYLMINEDGTTESRLVMAAKGRDGSIWRFKLDGGSDKVDVGSAKRIAELDPPGQLVGGVVNAGIWETSGITDTSDVFGDGTWIFASRPIRRRSRRASTRGRTGSSCCSRRPTTRAKTTSSSSSR